MHSRPFQLSKEFDLPFRSYPDSISSPLPGSALAASDKSYLSFFLNPAYLQARTQSILFEKFGDDSHILLTEFLNKEFASALEKELKVEDGKAGLRWWEQEGRDKAMIVSHTLGVDESHGWTISGPPHRQRFLSLGDKEASSSLPETNPPLPPSLPDNSTELLRLLQTHLFPSPAFRHFIANISQLIPIAARPIQVRRFRPGLDYTLARSDAEAVLDLTLGLTPDVGSMALRQAGAIGTAPKGLAGKKKAAKKPAGGEKITRATAKKLKEAWETGEVGGWEAYMPPVEEGDDPAVYGSGKKMEQVNGNGSAHQEPVDAGEDEEEEEGDDDDEQDVDMMDEDEDEDEDGVLLNLTPTYNTLSLVLRDERVMRFVKYLSASSGGSRWDLSAEFEVGAAVVEDDEAAE